MQDAPKAVWSLPYVSGACFPSLKQNFIAYHSSKVSSRPDCIFEIHQLWQSGFSIPIAAEPEIIRIGQSSHKMYSNNIVNFQGSTTILNAHKKKVWKLIWIHFVIGINLLNMADKGLMSVCLCVWKRAEEREKVRVWERDCICVRERERVCVRERERERERLRVCVREKERKREKETKTESVHKRVCVRDRERERERERERVCTWVCVWER